MVQRWFQLAHTHLPVDQGNPYRELYNTIPFSAHSTPPANSQTHQHNCMGPPGGLALLAALVARLAALVARLAAVVARLVEVVAQWEGTHDGELCNTTLSCQLPRYFLHPQRN